MAGRAGGGESPSPASLLWLRYQDPPPDYSRSVAALRQLAQTSTSHGARLAVIIFRIGREPVWERLVSEVTAGFESTQVPVLDLGPQLLAGHDETELWVHPSDAHPNEVAHQLAAEAIARFLDAERMLR